MRAGILLIFMHTWLCPQSMKCRRLTCSARPTWKQRASLIDPNKKAGRYEAGGQPESGAPFYLLCVRRARECISLYPSNSTGFLVRCGGCQHGIFFAQTEARVFSWTPTIPMSWRWQTTHAHNHSALWTRDGKPYDAFGVMGANICRRRVTCN